MRVGVAFQESYRFGEFDHRDGHVPDAQAIAWVELAEGARRPVDHHLKSRIQIIEEEVRLDQLEHRLAIRNSRSL